MCAASCTLSVPAGVDSYGKEARVAAAPPGTAITSFAGAVRAAKGRSNLFVGCLCSDGWAGIAKMVVERQVMNWVSVDSSVFASVAYLGDKRQLFLRFHSGKVYRYFGFPGSV